MKGSMASVCMHTPTTTIRLCGGASAMRDCSMPGTPTASKITGSLTSPPIMDAAGPFDDGRRHAQVGPAIVRRASAGSMTSSAPKASASRRRVGREVGGQHRPVAPALQGGDDGQPHRAAPDHQAGLAGFEAGQAHGVLAHGQGLGQGGQVGRRASRAPGGGVPPGATKCSARAPG